MQVVGYERDVGEGASLLLADSGRVRAVALDPGSSLPYGLGERRCAGALTADGHVPCQASAAPYCPAHDDTWVCARCTGTCLKDEMDCHQRHAIYLAAFAPDAFKVGVTRLRRLETRLREQGADRAAHLRTVSNGRIAREIEAAIARTVGDSVRVREKIRGLGRPVNEVAWESVLEGFDVRETVDVAYDLNLGAPPTPETMARGTVRGTKGRILLLDRDGSTYAVDMRDLVGHELREGGRERDRQASLGAYGRG